MGSNRKTSTIKTTTTTTATTTNTNRRQSSNTKTNRRKSSSSSSSSSSQQHSLIEKRRRERINDKIQKLKEIIPTCNPFSEQQPIRGPSFHQPLHKLAILEAAIDYIQQMHQTLLHNTNPLLMNDPKIANVIEHARQCREQQEEKKLSSSSSSSSSSFSSSS